MLWNYVNKYFLIKLLSLHLLRNGTFIVKARSCHLSDFYHQCVTDIFILVKDKFRLEDRLFHYL